MEAENSVAGDTMSKALTGAINLCRKMAEDTEYGASSIKILLSTLEKRIKMKWLACPLKP
jgi:hypothetical protein